MDVECSESQVITGMQETILNNHFELIVPCYHKKFDIVDLILITGQTSLAARGMEVPSIGTLDRCQKIFDRKH